MVFAFFLAGRKSISAESTSLISPIDGSNPSLTRPTGVTPEPCLFSPSPFPYPRSKCCRRRRRLPPPAALTSAVSQYRLQLCGAYRGEHRRRSPLPSTSLLNPPCIPPPIIVGFRSRRISSRIPVTPPPGAPAGLPPAVPVSVALWGLSLLLRRLPPMRPLPALHRAQD